MKYNNSLIDSLGTPYDYRSVMHYSEKAFSKNGLPTILVKQEGVCVRYIIRLFTYHQNNLHTIIFCFQNRASVYLMSIGQASFEDHGHISYLSQIYSRELELIIPALVDKSLYKVHLAKSWYELLKTAIKRPRNRHKITLN